MASYRIFGDSHCGALGGGVVRMRKDPGGPQLAISGVNMLGAATEFYVPFHRTEQGTIRLVAPKFADRMKGLCDTDGTMLLPDGERFLISFGLHTQSILAGRLFREHAPHFVRPQPTRGFVSTAALRDVLIGYHRHLLQFLCDLKDSGSDITVISAPPPTARYKALEAGYSAADLIRLDAFMRDVMRDQIGALSIPIIEPPPETIGEDGLLRPEYLHADETDPHHGNVDYGEAMLRHIARVLAQSDEMLEA